jgi:hypothetical protein
MDTIKHQPNNPTKAGQPASDKVIFGDYSRYALYAIHTRFDCVWWIVQDAETLDPIVPDMPAIIRQELRFEDAIDGLWTGPYHITNN